MSKKKVRYFTFPVELLRKAFIQKTGDKLSGIELLCDDAKNYAVYVRCQQEEETPAEAFEFFDITGKPDEAFSRGRELYDSFTRPVLVSVNTSVILDFLYNPKTDFDIAVFCAFCGIRSIIGTKSYASTNNGLLLARMFGYATTNEFEVLNPKPKYYQDFFEAEDKTKQKERIRYQLTERIIRKELEFNWGLKYYSKQLKGFYVSFKLNFSTLVHCAETKRKSNILKQKRAEKKQIIEEVKRQLG